MGIEEEQTSAAPLAMAATRLATNGSLRTSPLSAASSASCAACSASLHRLAKVIDPDFSVATNALSTAVGSAASTLAGRRLGCRASPSRLATTTRVPARCQASRAVAKTFEAGGAPARSTTSGRSFPSRSARRIGSKAATTRPEPRKPDRESARTTQPRCSVAARNSVGFSIPAPAITTTSAASITPGATEAPVASWWATRGGNERATPSKGSANGRLTCTGPGTPPSS